MRAGPIAVATLVLLAGNLRADSTILRPGAGHPSPLAGIRHAPAFDVDAAALRALRRAPRARLDAFPLGRRSGALELERFDPLARTRIEIVGPDGPRRAPRPDLAFFRGRVVGEPDSLAVLTAGAEGLRALVLAADGVSVVARDAAGRHRAWTLDDVDPAVHPPPAAFCLNDLADLERPPTLAEALQAAPPAMGTTHLGLRRAEIALETDTELRAKFLSDAAALAYLATLFAEASAIYERDVEIALDLSYIRLWSGTDPWTSSVPDGQLSELRAYWNAPANDMETIAGRRDAVHMLSGKTVLGGIAYIDAVCNASYGYGVSQVYGGFDLATPSSLWDLVVVAHELGHNFGTEHTHCYSPPIDTCYSGEPGCYVGPEAAMRSTLMSYCHLQQGGFSNIDLRFHDRVRDVLHATTATQGCLALDDTSPCGDGTLDAEEECDDGNRAGGDGCSAACRVEACGNGRLDLGEACDDGNALGGDGCSALCAIEVCGDGILQGGEACDDGNVTAGDGCSATCHVETCALYLPHQQVWSSARLVVKPGKGGLAFRAAFEVPATATIDAAERGLTLVGETAAGGTDLAVALPGGAAWSRRGTRLRYRDPAGSVAGIRRVVVKSKARGERIRVKVKAAGRGGAYPTTLAEMPARLTLVLGGEETAGASGGCGEWLPRIGACRSERGGKRLVCH